MAQLCRRACCQPVYEINDVRIRGKEGGQIFQGNLVLIQLKLELVQIS